MCPYINYAQNTCEIPYLLKELSIALTLNCHSGSTKSQTEEKDAQVLKVVPNKLDQPWKDVAQETYSLVGENYAIVYVDFKNDVEKMVESLKACGAEDTKGYHGRDMTVSAKVEIERAFRKEEIQVLVATESFELCTHSPHVNIVIWVSCARNMRVVGQELGRAAREENNGHFILFFNENKDDQRFGYSVDKRMF